MRLTEKILEEGATKEDAKNLVEELRNLGHDVEYGDQIPDKVFEQDFDRALNRSKRKSFSN